MNSKLWMFDYNGTAQNDFDVAYESLTAIFTHYHLPAPSAEIFRKEISCDYMKFYRKYGIPETATREELNKIRRGYFGKNQERVKLNPGFVGILNELIYYGSYAAIVSGEDAALLETQLTKFGLKSLFDYWRGDVSDKEKGMIEALDFFGVKAEESVYVGDAVRDIEAAKKLGVKAIAFIYPKSYDSEERLIAAKPDYQIKHFLEISDLIAEGI